MVFGHSRRSWQKKSDYERNFEKEQFGLNFDFFPLELFECPNATKICTLLAHKHLRCQKKKISFLFLFLLFFEFTAHWVQMSPSSDVNYRDNGSLFGGNVCWYSGRSMVRTVCDAPLARGAFACSPRSSFKKMGWVLVSRLVGGAIRSCSTTIIL